MNRTTIRLSLLFALAASIGCEGIVDVEVPEGVVVETPLPNLSSPTLSTPSADDPTSRDLPDPGERALDPTAPPSMIPTGRAPRRMTVDQLRRTIPRVFGRTWETQNGQNKFDAFSDTLGEADYLRSNVHVVDPTPIFAKSMDDMASEVCRVTLQEDPEQLLPHGPEAVEANLRHLRLLMHGIHVEPGCAAGIDDLVQLHTDVSQACAGVAAGCVNGIDNGWYAVCVAMVTDPEFMIY